MGKIKVKVFKTFGDTAEDIKKSLIESIQIISKLNINKVMQKTIIDSLVLSIRKLNGGMVYYEMWEEEKYKKRKHTGEPKNHSNTPEVADKKV